MVKREYNFYVYIMASSSGTLYIGMTNSLMRRVAEHKEGKIEGFYFDKLSTSLKNIPVKSWFIMSITSMFMTPKPARKR